MPDPLAIDLEQPLPVELTGNTHHWFSRYRRYPVFSRAWARGRLISWSTGLGLLLLMMAAVLAYYAEPERLPAGVAEMLLLVGTPMWVGPWLAGQVRRRHWPAGREQAGLWLAVLATVVLMQVFVEFGAEPLKQRISEWTGNVDDQGKRRQVVMSIGVAISESERSEPALPGPAGSGRKVGSASPVNQASNLILAFWMAGGVALFGWRRERAGLQALQAKRELDEAQARRREAELRLSVLAAQVEPHFLFNTLAGVRSAIHSDPPRASEMIDRLVDYLRASIPRLRSDGSAQATVAAQFELVRAYLALMSARMPRLHYTIALPDDLRQARCPPLMLISLAENAVKHGVEMKVGPCHVELRAARGANGELALSVLDDGVGFGASQAGTGLGLTNIRERLAQLYPGRASLVLKSRPEGGVAATITLPLEHAHDSP